MENADGSPGWKAAFSRWGWPATVGLLVALAGALRLWELDLRPPHFDEGVNGMFTDRMRADGYYRYDPTNYHGPLHFYLLFLFKALLGRNLWALRLPTALASTASVWLVTRFERFFDRRLCALAALGLALSPASVFYGRDAIHESWLTFFLILNFYGLVGLWEEGRRGDLWAAGLGIAGAVLIKETYVLHFGCLALALPVWWALETILLPGAPPPPRLTSFSRAPAEPSGFPEPGPFVGSAESTEPAEPGAAPVPPPLPPPVGSAGRVAWLRAAPFPTPPRGPVRPAWGGRDLLAVGAAAGAAIVLFYSGLCFHWAGLAGLLQTFAPWFHKGQAGEGHIKPVWYWVWLLATQEPWAAAGAAAALGFAVWPRVDPRLRFLAIAALGTGAAYSLIPYKTPWCMASIVWPFFFLFAGALVAMVRWRPRVGAGVALVATVPLALWTARRTGELNFARYVDEQEPYVYVQTYQQVDEVVLPLLDLVRQDPTKYELRGVILTDSPHPLPWLLGDFYHVGYYTSHRLPADYRADFLVVEEARVAPAERQFREPYFKQTIRLRPALTPLCLYLRAAVFAPLFPGRTPEFVPPASPLPPPPPSAGQEPAKAPSPDADAEGDDEDAAGRDDDGEERADRPSPGGGRNLTRARVSPEPSSPGSRLLPCAG